MQNLQHHSSTITVVLDKDHKITSVAATALFRYDSEQVDPLLHEFAPGAFHQLLPIETPEGLQEVLDETFMTNLKEDICKELVDVKTAEKSQRISEAKKNVARKVAKGPRA